jgi:hypothetical protein
MADQGVFRMDGDGDNSDDEELDMLEDAQHKRRAQHTKSPAAKLAQPVPTKAAAPTATATRPAQVATTDTKSTPFLAPLSMPGASTSPAPPASPGPPPTPGGPIQVLEAGKMSVKDFELLHVIGRGAYGKVRPLLGCCVFFFSCSLVAR